MEMFENQKSERVCQGMYYGGIGAGAVYLLLILAVLFGGKASGLESLLRALSYLITGGACGIFAWIGYLGVRRVTQKRYLLGCFVLSAGLLLHFFSSAFLYMHVTGAMASAYLLGSMLFSLLGFVFLLYVGVDAKEGFYQRRNDAKLLLFLLGVSVVLALLVLGMFGAASPFVWPEVLGLFVTNLVRLALPTGYICLVDRIRDPYTDEEVAADLERRRELRLAAQEEKRQKKLAKEEAKRQAIEAERQKKLAEEEAKRQAIEEERRKAEEARLAEEARQKAEQERLAAEALQKEQEKAEEDAKTKAKRLAAAEARRLAPEIFGCSLEEFGNEKRA